MVGPSYFFVGNGILHQSSDLLGTYTPTVPGYLKLPMALIFSLAGGVVLYFLPAPMVCIACARIRLFSLPLQGSFYAQRRFLTPIADQSQARQARPAIHSRIDTLIATFYFTQVLSLS